MTAVTARKKLVDATQLQQQIPKAHEPTFDIDASADCVPVNGLASIGRSHEGCTVIGSGESAMDAVAWLLGHGVAPDAIRWIRPQDCWVFNRGMTQPLEGLPQMLSSQAATMRAAADATDVVDASRRLEASGVLMRIDAAVEPTMWRWAILREAEIERLRLVEDVVRLGNVQRLAGDAVTLDGGTVPVVRREFFVDCTSDWSYLNMDLTIVEGDRIDLQPVRTCQPCFNSALVAFLECNRDDDAEKNRLRPANPYPLTTTDWMRGLVASNRNLIDWNAEPDLPSWIERTRLNISRGLVDREGEPAVAATLPEMVQLLGPSTQNLGRLLTA